MSTDGGGTADAARRLASRIKALAEGATAAAAVTARRSRVLGGADRGGALMPARFAPPGPGPGPGADEQNGPGLSASQQAAGGYVPGSGQAPEQGEQRIGPAIMRAADAHVPLALRVTAAWSWRLLLVAGIVYLTFKITVALRLLVLPFIAAILLCALLQPLAARMARAGMPRLAATWLTLLAAIGVLAGVAVLITNQIQSGYRKLSAEVLKTVKQVLHDLSGPPFRLNGAKLDQLSSKLVNYLEQHKTVVAGTVLTGGKYFLEVLAGLILTIFITFFLLKDGEMLWARLLRGFERFRGAGPDSIERSNRASGAAWQALVRYIHGTTVIAVIHAVLIGIALWLLGVPLIMPLAILVFIAAYVPLVGILVVGALAILVTLATQGWIAAVILLAVFLAENQLESHLLQPLIIGRAVRLHPLEIIMVLAVGGIVAGIPGAIVAVPTAAVVSAAWRSNHEPRRRDGTSDRSRDRRGRAKAGGGKPAEPESAHTETAWAQTSATEGSDAHGSTADGSTADGSTADGSTSNGSSTDPGGTSR